ncbi:MAG: spermidine synthase [Sphingomonadaceae bacterium]
MATAAANIARTDAAPRLLFIATIFTGSFLLFLMQPMIARMALPRLGGAPAVWNSAMLVYQALLLGGYAYAHVIGRLTPRRQAALHLILFLCATLWLPLGLGSATMPTDISPILWVPWLLLASIGPLFFIVSAQAPLIQRWIAIHSPDTNPYTLYIASNLGSFGGLLAYPLLVEPLIPIASQSVLWSAAYGVLLVLMAGCALLLPSRGTTAKDASAEASSRPSAMQRLQWIALAAVPSGMILATTSHLTTDLVAMPLIWVIPLGLYLLSFSFAFSNESKLTRLITRYFPLILIIAGTMAGSGKVFNLWSSVAADLVLLFGTAVTLHHALYRMRPAVAHLTDFYLCMSAGGVVGGLFGALIAPALFDALYEFPILIVAAALLMPFRSDATALTPLHRRWSVIAALLLSMWAGGLVGPQSGVMMTLLLVVIAFLARWTIGYRVVFSVMIAALMLGLGGWSSIIMSLTGDVRSRSYFGIYTVADTKDARTLYHGTTIHGIQLLTPGLQTYPTSYYGPLSGVGVSLRAAPKLYGAEARIGVVGLGAGTLACYAQPGQSWRFYEIDPEVARIARDSSKFSFLSRCLPDALVEIGDARLTLAGAPRQSADMLVIDAFSSDAIPMHLLTREAIASYGRVLAADGLLLFHISNRYIDLKPVLSAAASADGWHAVYRDYEPPKKDARYYGGRSVWVAFTRSSETLLQLKSHSPGPKAWSAMSAPSGFSPWTDDYGSILPLLRKP